MSSIIKGLVDEQGVEETKKLSAQEKFKRSMKRAGYDMDAGAKRLQDLLAKQKKEREEFEKKEVKENETLQYAAEVTPKVSPYAGIKDRKFRGAIGEGIKQMFENPNESSTDSGYQQGGWRKMNEQEVSEDLRKWFKEKWVRFGPDGKIRGACARGDDSEGKPKCLPQAKAHALGKKGRKYAAAKKRREDPNPERSGPAKNVATKKKSNESLKEFAPNFRDDGDSDSRDIDRLREEIYSLLMKKLANVEGDPQDIAIAAMEVADDIASESELVDFTKLSKWVEMVLNKVQGVAEAGMPSSVIKSKQRYSQMTPAEFYQAHKDKSDKELISMAWRHGYGKDSNHYVDKRNKGKQGVAEANSPEEFLGQIRKLARTKQKFKVGDWVVIDPNETSGYASSGMTGRITNLYNDEGEKMAEVAVGGASGIQKKMKLGGGVFGPKGMELDLGKGIRSAGTKTSVPLSLLQKFDTSMDEQGVAEGYTGRETKDGTWRVFKDGKAVAVAGPYKSREEAAAWIKKQKQGVAEGATVTRIDSKPITDFASNLKTYRHTDDWSQSGLDTDDDSYWKNKNLKTKTTKGLFAGDPRRTALYATGNAHETRYVEFTQNGEPIVYFDRKDIPAMRNRKTYLTVFNAANFRKLPTGEWFSENPGKPIKQTPIGDPFKYIADQGWTVRVTDDLNKVFKQVKKMHQAGKISQYGAEGMNESKQGVAEGSLNEGIPKNATEKKLFELLQAWGFFISFKSMELKNHGVDQAATNALLDMFRTYTGPVINGMKWTEITKGDLWQNPKVIPHLLKYIYQAIPYVEARIKKFVRPEKQAQYLDYIDTYLKPAYKEVVSLYSNPSVKEQGVVEGSKYPRNPASYHLKKYPVPPDQLARPVKKEPKKPEKKPDEKLDELKCWSGYTRVKGVPAGAPGSCKKKTNEEHQQCPECGGAMYEASLMNEKKDACYYKVKSRYKVWPSAYASGALVKCRKKGAKNWGSKSKSNEGQIYSTGGGAGQAQRYYTPKDNLGETKSNILFGLKQVDEGLKSRLAGAALAAAMAAGGSQAQNVPTNLEPSNTIEKSVDYNVNRNEQTVEYKGKKYNIVRLSKDGPQPRIARFDAKLNIPMAELGYRGLGTLPTTLAGDSAYVYLP